MQLTHKDSIALAIEALEDGLSVCRSVSTGRDRRVVTDGCVSYSQTEEWCKWLEDEVAAKLNAALAALRARPTIKYLCNGVSFKVHVRNGDAMLPWLPDELGGRWVALVAAEDDCHLRDQPDNCRQTGTLNHRVTKNES
jgi:hypothetical protein